jgi:hypothetical protein
LKEEILAYGKRWYIPACGRQANQFVYATIFRSIYELV